MMINFNIMKMKVKYYLVREREIREKMKGYLKQTFYIFTTFNLFEYIWENPYPTIEYYWRMFMEKRSKWSVNYKNYIYPLKFMFKNNLGVDYNNKYLYFKLKSGVWFQVKFSYLQVYDNYMNSIQISSVLVYPDIRKQVFDSQRDEKFYDLYELVYPFVVRYKFNPNLQPIDYIPKKSHILEQEEEVEVWR